jgi:GNAT superfamily N-acetyltransferase
MPDMLVKLYELPDIEPTLAPLREKGITIRHAMPYELTPVLGFVHEHFGQGWADECAASFAHQPVSCILATQGGAVLGFACYDATCRDYFGPTGVMETYRKQGIGKALLLASLAALREMGYAYAIIGGAGPVDFYANAVGATVIEGSIPGIYRDGLQG